MKMSEVIEKLPVKLRAGAQVAEEKEISGGICSDLLSYVMANAKENYLWVTIQTHQNIVAVASLLGLAGIIITGGVEPDDDTVKRADSEGIPIFVTNLPSFELIAQMSKIMG